MRASDDREWKQVKRGIRDIRAACHRIGPIKNGSGIRCFAATDRFQNEMRRIFQERRQRRR